MRVLLLVTDLDRGGAPLRLARTARALRDAGETVVVGCLAHHGAVSDALEADGIATFACGAGGPRDLPAIGRLVAHVRRLAPDLIHATLTHANVAARLVGLWTRTPVLTSTATIEVERRWHRWAERLTARLDAGHVVNGTAVAAHVRRAFALPPGRVHVIPPAIGPLRRVERATARAALDLAAHEFVVAWAGRFDPVKRLDQVVRTAELLGDRPTRFLLAGDGPLRADIERLAASSSAARRMRFLGWLDDLSELLAAADAFFFPSLTEGMPNAVLEAMAAGLPVVGSDIPALRELDGGAQRLVLIDSGAPRVYAQALRQLSEDPPLRAAIGARAAAFSAQHAEPRIVARRLQGLYRSVVRRAPGSS